MSAKVVRSKEEAQVYAPRFVFPVELAAAFVIGGWKRTAANQEELDGYLEEALRLSPVEEVRLRWNVG